ncbi:MAG: hypothetical protein DMG65_09475 [Candidatus Angelobacter sp. Gp1-AA117]|nr:MAG: hypothetical protein DMG65_09475 [Candidatus Angelobacter sp. Gp1-AA117]
MGISNAISAAVVLASLALQSPAQAPSADTLQEAESFLQKQQYEQAEVRLQGLVKTQPGNPQAWFDLGFAESHLNKNPEAITAYRKAAELSPKWFEANQNLGLTLARAGNFPEAAKALGTAVQLKPTVGGQKALIEAWQSLAQVLEETDAKEALEAYARLEELRPGDAEVISGKGRMMERTGDAAGAEQQYIKAATMGSNAGVERLVDLYLKQKRLADAETWLQKYVEKNPKNTLAQAQLGKVLMAEGKTKEAIANLEAVNTASPDPAVSRVLSNLYAENKQYAEASKLLQQLVEQSPRNAELHWNYGEALLHQHNYADAEAELIKALQLNSKLTDAYWELAYAADQNKHYELAVRVLDARAKLLPETAGTYWLRATSYDNLRIYKPAAENYKLFLAASGGKSPDQEFQARHRLKAIEPQ